MVWVKIDDDFPQHPKARKAGAIGMALWLAGLCYSSHYLTDGLIPVEALAALLPLEKKDLARTIDRLVFAGLWSVAEGGYEIHDYLDYQSSRKDVIAERDRVRNWREGRKRTRTERVLNGDGTRNVPDPTPTPIPIPTPKKQKTPPPKGSRGQPPPFHSAEKRAGPIPANFQPSPEMLSWAAKQRPSVDAQDRTLTFINHAVATGRELVEWEAGWKNWILDSEKHSNGLARTNGHSPPQPNGQRSQNQINADIAARRMGLNPADTDPFGGAPDEPWSRRTT